LDVHLKTNSINRPVRKEIRIIPTQGLVLRKGRNRASNILPRIELNIHMIERLFFKVYEM